MIKRLTLFLLLFTSNAYAITEICGDGIDNDATGGDLACPSPDADFDGYYSSGGGYFSGTDCDDSDRFIYPGSISLSGCSAGQYKVCASNGTLSACRSVDTLHTDVTGGTSTIVISSAVGASTCTGAGTVADPKGILCFSNSGLSGYSTPSAGKVYAILAGTYTTPNWSDAGTTRQLYLNNKDGTVSNPIYIIGIGFPTITNAGSNPTEVFTADISNSDYVRVHGLNLTGNGYSSGAIHYFDSPNGLVEGNKVAGLDGIVGSNNVACIKIRGVSASTPVRHNTVGDCYAHADVTNENSYGILFMDSDYPTAEYNVIINATNVGHGLAVKHGVVGGNPGTFYGNITAGSYYADIIFEQPQMTVSHNYINATGHAGEVIDYRYLGAHPDFDRAVISYNTIVNGPAFNILPDPTYNVRSSIASFHHNVVIDDRATAYILGASDGFWRIYEYGSNASYTDVITGGKITSTSNCYYNSAGTPLGFVVYGDVGAGASGQLYSTFAAVQAAGWESGSYSENPTLDSYNRATSANCGDKGYLIVPAAGGTGTGFGARGKKGRAFIGF